MFEVIEVQQDKVACDGSGGPLGHPRVYLHIDHDKGDQVVCPYCSRTYVMRNPHTAHPSIEATDAVTPQPSRHNA